jgi:uncharacterized membrane protein
VKVVVGRDVIDRLKERKTLIRPDKRVLASELMVGCGLFFKF